MMQKDALRIVIADDEPITRIDLKETLTEKGYIVVGEASDGFDAVELCKKHMPDVALLDIKMPHLDGISAAKIIIDEMLSGTVIILSAYSDRTFINSAKDISVGGYMVKPIDEKHIVPNIELAVERAKEVQKLKNDLARIEKRLQDRTVIERAKGKIMHRDNVTEQEAYDYIRALSQKKNMSMRRVAEIMFVQAGG